MKKILLPIDFSEVSDNAFVYSLVLAHFFKADLVLLHTYELPIVDSQSMPINYSIIYETVELTNFDHFKNKLPELHAIAEKRNLGHIKMSHILMNGNLIHSIKKVVNQENIDLVVMGTMGVDGWLDSFLGTNTGAVISDVSVPVLSVPIGAKFNKFKNIAFTTCFREKDKEALEEVLLMAKKLNAKVKCLHIKTSRSDVSATVIDKWKFHFEKEKDLEFFIIPSNQVTSNIKDFLTSEKIDLLAMLTYKRNFFIQFFKSTTTQKLSYHLKTPILALHE